MKIQTPSTMSGVILIEVLIAMIIISTTLIGCLTIVQNFQQTSITTSLHGAALRTAQRYRNHFTLVGLKSISDVPLYSQIGANSGGLLPSGKNTVTIGSQLAPHQFNVTWQTDNKYTKEADLYSGPQSSGCPYPLIKQISIAVSWQDLDGQNRQLSLKTSVSHPLLRAHPEKLFHLDAVGPSP